MFLGSHTDPVYPSSTDVCRANKFSFTCHVYSCTACAAQAKSQAHMSQILWDSQTAKFKHCRFNVPLLRRQHFCSLLCRQQQKWKDVRKRKPFSPKIGWVDWIPWSSPQVCPTIFSLQLLVPDPPWLSCLEAPCKLPHCLLTQDASFPLFPQFPRGCC